MRGLLNASAAATLRPALTKHAKVVAVGHPRPRSISRSPLAVALFMPAGWASRAVSGVPRSLLAIWAVGALPAPPPPAQARRAPGAPLVPPCRGVPVPRLRVQRCGARRSANLAVSIWGPAQSGALHYSQLDWGGYRAPLPPPRVTDRQQGPGARRPACTAALRLAALAPAPGAAASGGSSVSGARPPAAAR